MATCKPCGKSWTGTRLEHCTVCHQTFGGSDAGERHRVGSFTNPDDPRRCLAPNECGMRLDAKGIWSTRHSRDRK